MHYFIRHFGTVAVLAMMIMFLLAARRREHVAHAMIALAMSAGFAAIGMSLAIFGDPALWTTPAPYAWGPIAILGILGVLLRSKPAQPMNTR